MNLFASNSAFGPYLLQDFSKISSAVSGSRREAKVQMAELPRITESSRSSALPCGVPMDLGLLGSANPHLQRGIGGSWGPISDFQRKLLAQDSNSIWSKPFFSAWLNQGTLHISAGLPLQEVTVASMLEKIESKKQENLFGGCVCLCVFWENNKPLPLVIYKTK